MEVLGKVVDVKKRRCEGEVLKKYIIEYKVKETSVRIPFEMGRNTWKGIHKGFGIRIRHKSNNPYKYIIVNDPFVFAIRCIVILAIIIITAANTVCFI